MKIFIKIIITIIVFSFLTNCCSTKQSTENVKKIIYLTDSSVMNETIMQVEKDNFIVNERLEMMVIENDEDIVGNMIDGTTNIDNNLTILQNGTLAFKIDSVFIIDVVSRVDARIIKSIDDGEVSEMIEMFEHTTNGNITKRVIPVDNIMDMKLYSFDRDAFDIFELSSGDQFVDSITIAHWIWSVKPLKIGQQELIIKAIIKKDGANIEHIVYDEKINVMNKPKMKYKISLDIKDEFISKKKNIINLEITQCDDCEKYIKWGNNGILILDIDNEENFEIQIDNNQFNEIKFQEYKWDVKPLKKGEYNYSIILQNDNERLILIKDKIIVKNEIKSTFMELLDFWEFLLTFLIIPIYLYVRKKMRKVK